MEDTSGFQVSITGTEVIVRFQKNSYPAEIAAIEAAQAKVDAALRSGDQHYINQTAIELHQRILALLRAPSEEHQRNIGLR